MLTPREIANLAPDLSGDNLIINGNMLIAQRGDFLSAPYETTNQEYTVDRYATLSSGNQPSVQQQSTDLPEGFTRSLRTTSTVAAVSHIYTAQFIEGVEELVGKDLIMSAWVKSNSPYARLKLYQGAAGWSGEQEEVGVGTHPGDGQWHKLTMKVKVSALATELRCCVALRGPESQSSGTVSLGIGDYYEFTGHKVEVGEQATPYIPRNYGEELLLCQRYFERGSTVDGMMCTYSPDFSRFNTINFAARKRNSPTMGINFVSSVGDTGSYVSLYSNNATIYSFGSTFNWSGGVRGEAFAARVDWTADSEY